MIPPRAGADYETRQFWWRRPVVYRCYAADGRLLYIGTTQDIVTRLKSHRSTSPWFAEVARTVVKLASDRLSGFRMEVEAIRAEQPIHNVRHAAGWIEPQDKRRRRKTA